MSSNWSRVETKKGEVATAIAIGAILLLGAVSLATSVFLNRERLKTKPRAQDNGLKKAEENLPIYFQPFSGPTVQPGTPTPLDYGRPYRYFFTNKDGKSLVCFQNLRPTKGYLMPLDKTNWDAWVIKSYQPTPSCPPEAENTWNILFGAKQTTPTLPPKYNRKWKTLCRMSEYDELCKKRIQEAMNSANSSARATPTSTNTPTNTPTPKPTKQTETPTQAEVNEKSSTGSSTSPTPSTPIEKNECEAKGGICLPSIIRSPKFYDEERGEWQPHSELNCGKKDLVCWKKKESSGRIVSPSVSTPKTGQQTPQTESEMREDGDTGNTSEKGENNGGDGNASNDKSGGNGTQSTSETKTGGFSNDLREICEQRQKDGYVKGKRDLIVSFTAENPVLNDFLQKSGNLLLSEFGDKIKVKLKKSNSFFGVDKLAKDEEYNINIKDEEYNINKSCTNNNSNSDNNSGCVNITFHLENLPKVECTYSKSLRLAKDFYLEIYYFDKPIRDKFYIIDQQVTEYAEIGWDKPIKVSVDLDDYVTVQKVVVNLGNNRDDSFEGFCLKEDMRENIGIFFQAPSDLASTSFYKVGGDWHKTPSPVDLENLNEGLFDLTTYCNSQNQDNINPKVVSIDSSGNNNVELDLINLAGKAWDFSENQGLTFWGGVEKELYFVWYCRKVDGLQLQIVEPVYNWSEGSYVVNVQC